MGHGPDYITAHKPTRAATVSLLRGAQASPATAVRNVQPTLLPGRGFFLCPLLPSTLPTTLDTGTLEGRSKHNHSTLSIRTCTTISTLAHWPDRNGGWWRNASRYSGAVLASNDYVVGPRPRTSGPGFRPARPGGLPDDSQRHRHNPVRSRGTPQQDIKKDNGHGVVVET